MTLKAPNVGIKAASLSYKLGSMQQCQINNQHEAMDVFISTLTPTQVNTYISLVPKAKTIRDT